MNIRIAMWLVLGISAVLASPSRATSTNLLSVYGEARLGNGQLAGEGFRVTVENLTRGTRDSVFLRAADAGRFVVTFVDYESNVAAAVGDRIRATLKDPSGAIVPVPAEATVSQQHVDTHLLLANVNPLTVGVDPVGPGLALLSRPHPEPSRAGTRIRYRLGQAGHVVVSIVDVTGRLVQTLVDEENAPGVYERAWDGRTASGLRVAPGVYYVRMTTGKYDAARRITIVH